MSGQRAAIVDRDHEGSRLDVFVVAAVPGLSRSAAQKLIDSGHVRVSGQAGRASSRLRTGDVVSVELKLPVALSAEPESMDLDLVYEDDAMAVIDKPAGLVVHPAPGHSSGTLVNGLLRRYPGLSGSDEIRPGLVHRLDKDTSGLMVIALSSSAQLHLSRQIQTRLAKRVYAALVWGVVEPESAVVDIPVGRDPVSRKKMAAGLNTIRPRPARSRFAVVERFARHTLLDVTLETGRTHQIRVHMASIGHPVAGDSLYSSRRLAGLSRQFLHAKILELESPKSGRSMRFESDLPSDLRQLLEKLRDEVRSPSTR